MKLVRYSKNPILKPNLKLTWEASSVFNPSVVYNNGIFHMLYRAVAAGFRPKLGGGYTNYISSIGYATSKDILLKCFLWQLLLGCCTNYFKSNLFFITSAISRAVWR